MLFRASGIAEKFDSLEQDKRDGSHLRMDPKFFDGIVRTRDVTFIGDIVADVARGKFKEGIGGGKKTGRHDGRIGGIAYIRGKERRCEE